MGDLTTRATLHAQGFDDDGIRAELIAGRLRRVWPGVYTHSPQERPWIEYRRTVRAASLTAGTGVTSHQSAGSLWNLPILHPDLSRVHTTIDDNHGGGIVSAYRHVHPRPLPTADIETIDGVSVTSLARTAVDIAMQGTYEQALVVVDGARRVRRFINQSGQQSVSAAQLVAMVEALGRRKGKRVALRAIADSVSNSESAGESWSRARMIQWRLPKPELQAPLSVDGNTYFADFRWGKLIGEFDGAEKYGSDAERLRREKRRDSDLASLGFTVCHWTWDDLRDRGRFFRIITRAMVNSGVLNSVPTFPG